jgi:hypothetical protein
MFPGHVVYTKREEAESVVGEMEREREREKDETQLRVTSAMQSTERSFTLLLLLPSGRR